MIRLLRNLPISVKAFSASALLLICIAALGTQAFVFLSGLKGDLKSLSDSSLPKQRQVLDIAKGTIDTHVDVFRYVAWASTGVNPATLTTLESQVRRELAHVTITLAELSQRSDLSARERDAVTNAADKWQRYSDAASDTIEISTKDPALGTLMLGGTDDDYGKVASDIQAISSLVTAETRLNAQDLLSQADANQNLIAWVAVIAILLGLAITSIFSRSIVAPIAAVTKALQAVSVGNAADVQLTDRGDEIGQMWSAISVFRRKLEYDNQLLTARERELTTQNVRFDAALNNMSRGLVMFDADDRLTVANRHYLEMYGLAEGSICHGCGVRDLLEARAAAGTFGGDIDDYLARLTDVAIERKTTELPDGRMINIVNRRMSDGGWISTHEDVTEQRRVEQRIADMAQHDPLTGLPNRILFRERMEQALTRVTEGASLAVLSIDLDGFKEVNDTFGHPAGDRLLRDVAERLQRCVCDDGVVARLGGDEFAMIHVNVQSREETVSLANRILRALDEPLDVEGHDIKIGGSIGIAVAPDHGDEADKLLKHADMALYRAKAIGRRTYYLFEPEMNLQLLHRRSLEADLRGALKRREFELHYQPFINVITNQVTGFEALIRWHHPANGVIAPSYFIPLAEETGLINPIGDWVLREACREAANWPAHLQVAVNLSPMQLKNRSLPEAVVLAIAAAGLDPKRLELEITETALLQDDELLLTGLHQLRELGLRIAMDDFGTGYSSLKYLRSFPFDKIKIDRSFVQELGIRPDSAAIVRALTELGRSLAMTTTAEGVETEAQLDHLKKEGCTEVQGYLFSRPRPAKDLASLLTTLEKRLAA